MVNSLFKRPIEKSIKIKVATEYLHVFGLEL
jgi:hypothetical protein